MMGQDLAKAGLVAWVSAAAMAASLLWSGVLKAQEGPPIPKPTAEHKVLAEDVGTWDCVTKSYMAGPDAEPLVSKGVEVNTLLPGGLWLLSEFKGEFAGTAFVGRGQFGYDTDKKMYVGTWIDSMVTSLMVLEGSYDAKTKSMTFTGEGVDPQTKAKYTQKMVTVTKPDGTRHFTMYMKFAGTDKDVKFLEMTYTKRK